MPWIDGVAHRLALEAARKQGPVQRYLLDPDNPYDYGRLLTYLWQGHADPLVIIEHDVVVPEWSLWALIQCDHAWCGHGYAIAGQHRGRLLGCMKISEEAKRATFDRVREELGSAEWTRCDQVLVTALHEAGYIWHEHMPPARHLHRYDEALDAH